MTLAQKVLFSLAVAALPVVAGCSSSTTSAPPPPPANTTVFGSTDAGSGLQIKTWTYPISSSSVATASLSSGAPTNLAGASWMMSDSAGRLWVLNESTSPTSITVYTLPVSATSAPVATLNLPAAAGAFHMAFDPAGNLWVASTGNASVFEYNGPWGAVTGTSTPAVNKTLSSGLSSPEGLAFDAAGDLLVANEGSTTISIFTAPIANGASPSGTLNGVTAPDSIVFDHSANLYVGKVNGDIARYNAPVTAGSSPNTINPAAVTTAADIEGIAVDNASNLFVMSCNSNVLEFPTGTTAFSATMAPSVSLTFSGCGGVFVL